MLTEMVTEECKNSSLFRNLTSYHRLSILDTHCLQEITAFVKVETCSRGKSLTSDISLQPIGNVKNNTYVIY